MYPNKKKFIKNFRFNNKYKKTNFQSSINSTYYRSKYKYIIYSLNYNTINSDLIIKTKEYIQKVLNQKVLNRLFTHRSLSKKSLGSRIGKGKGPINQWVFIVYPNCNLFEFDFDVNQEHTIKKITLNLSKRLPFIIKYRIIEK